MSPRTEPWDDDKAVRGKNGWLFLDNDSNRVMLQHAGKLLFTAQELKQWQRRLENRIAWLARASIHYRFMVPPVSSSVYPEFLPDHIPSGKTRPVLQLIDHLAACGSFAQVIYPIEELTAAKRTHDVYERTESHWNGNGQLVAYECLMRDLQDDVECHMVRREDVDFRERRRPGDLGHKFDPPEESLYVFAKSAMPPAHLVYDNAVFNNGATLALECDDAPDTTCVMFGDSFSYGILMFVASSFRRVVFAHMPSMDYDLVEEHDPDVVINVLNERFLYNWHGADENAVSTRERAQQKRSEGITRPEARLWPRRDSVHFKQTSFP